MALSSKTRSILSIAMANKSSAKELADAVDAGGNSQAASVAAFGVISALPSSNASLSTANTYTDAAVKAAIDGAVNSIGSPAQTRLANLESKANAILASLKAAGLMATP